MLKRLLFNYLNNHARTQLQSDWAQVSVISSVYDSPGKPNEELKALISPLAEAARTAELPLLQDRSVPKETFDWPGEHYKLLEGIIKVLGVKNVVEVGTFTGLSALAMLGALPAPGSLTTFDIVPWDQIPGTFLRPTDFSPGHFAQQVSDLSEEKTFESFSDLFKAADLVFIDGPKNGTVERAIIKALGTVKRPDPFYVLFDDTRIWKMLPIWRGINHPKLDLTSLGHFTGTGIAHWRKSPAA